MLINASLRDNRDDELLKSLKENNPTINTDHYRCFMQLLHSYYESACQEPGAVTGINRIVLDRMFDALFSDYRQGVLDKQQRSALEAVLTICKPPEELPALMRNFAEAIATRWQKCNPKNLDEVAQLAKDIFFGITDIHAYFNGNGRSAIAMTNLFLRSLGHPDILLRHSNEKNDPNSSYSQAIKLINQEPQRLVDHIKQRLRAARKSNPTVNPLKVQIIELRVALGQKLRAIEKLGPDFDLQRQYNHLSDSPKATLLAQQIESHLYNQAEKSANRCIIEMLNLQIAALSKWYDDLNQRIAQQRSQTVSKKYDSAEVKKIKQNLISLTGIGEGWNCYNTNALTILLHVASLEQANDTAKKLSATNALQAEAMKITDTEKFVVKITQINADKLAANTPPIEKNVQQTRASLGSSK